MKRLLSFLVAIGCAVGIASPSPAQRAARSDPASNPIIAGSFVSPRPSAKAPHPGRHGPLTEQEREIARIAWRYFENNTQEATGLVNSVDKFPSTTLWDIGSSVAAIISAQRFGLIPEADATARLSRMLDTLARIELFRSICPNKAYNSATAARVTYSGEPGEIGCSALDVGRLLVWMRIIEQRYPALAPKARAAVAHWNIGALVRDRELYGTALDKDGKVVFLQEGRLGYEEYGAKAFRLWGYDTAKAARAEPYGTISMYGIRIPYDARDPRLLGAHNYVVTESYALDGIEFGWDEPGDTTSSAFEHSSGWIAAAAQRVYLAQQRRFERTGILTARTEHQLAGAPYFVYDTVFSDGMPWATITDTGVSHPEYAAVAIKGALGLWVLWDTPYTDRLFSHVRTAYDPQRGFYEGLLEQGGGKIDAFTANNNGIILQTLLYKVEGKLYRSEPLGTPIQPQAARAPPHGIAAARAPPQAPSVAPPAATSSSGTDLPGPLASPIVKGALVSAPSTAGAPQPGRQGPLTAQERAMAEAAWRYFRNNTVAATGLVNAVHNYNSSTLWDTAAALAGIVSAHELDLIGAEEAEQRLGALLGSLNKIRRFRGICPNKAFDTRTSRPTNYANVPEEIGCSALDTGRALIWLRVVHNRYPALRPATEQLVGYWNIPNLVRDGAMYGTTVSGGQTLFLQEGRLGYEEYAAKGFQLWGQNTPAASAPEPFATIDVEGVAIAHDVRDAKTSGGHNSVVTESYTLDGVEFGWDEAGDRTSGPFEHSMGWMAANAHHIYLAQERRHARTQVLTARSEHQLAAAPHFVYDTIYSDGTRWATIDVNGKAVPEGAAVALKAALGIWALWSTPYADQLFAAVAKEYDPERGFYEGVLEKGGRINAFTANNNGIILETLLYKVKGAILRLPPR